MYKCPKGCADPKPVFVRVDSLARNTYLDAGGEQLRTSQPVITDRATVKCAYCAQPAEWIDARQGELFAVAPKLEGMEA